MWSLKIFHPSSGDDGRWSSDNAAPGAGQPPLTGWNSLRGGGHWLQGSLADVLAGCALGHPTLRSGRQARGVCSRLPPTHPAPSRVHSLLITHCGRDACRWRAAANLAGISFSCPLCPETAAQAVFLPAQRPERPPFHSQEALPGCA